MRALKVMIPLIVIGLVGCGGPSLPSPVPVSGKVLLGGKPVDGASVTFIGVGGGRSASGKTAADGTFKLTTINTNDGAPPGEYTVTIAKQEAPVGGAEIDVTKGQFGPAYGAQMGAAALGKWPRLRSNFSLPSTLLRLDSGLKRSVVKGEPNDFTIEL